jgi:hypothetical protein
VKLDPDDPLIWIGGLERLHEIAVVVGSDCRGDEGRREIVGPHRLVVVAIHLGAGERTRLTQDRRQA